MLSKVINIILIICFFVPQTNSKLIPKKGFVIIAFYDSAGKVITNGYLHILSNDLQVNDISFCEWDEIEKKGKNKIPKNGYSKVLKTLIEANNKMKSDSISIVYRCDKGLGNVYRLPINLDTVLVMNVKKCFE